MAGIKIPVAAEFSSADAEKSVQQFRQQMNSLGQQIAQTNRVKFTPIDKATVEDVRRVVQQFEQLRRIQGGLNQRLKATGQSNAGFLDVDWNRLYADANARGRAMQKAFEYVTGSTFQDAGAGPGTAPPGRQRHRAPDPNPNRQPRSPGGGSGGGGGGGVPGMAAGVAQAGLRAAGPAGGVAAGALGTGMSAGFGAGLMGLVGGMLALGVGKAVSAVREKVGAAEQESIQYDTLKRSLGDVNVSFRLLRDSVRASAATLGVNFDEAQRLAVSFARLSNATHEHANALGEEVRVGGGLSRAFGMDPSQGVGFSAQMRLFGVTQNEQDSRRMALLVGETIARASGFSQAGQILQAISSYTEQQTRLGLNSANVAGYSGYLSAAAGSGIAGLDPMGAAGLLARVNSSVQSGGAAGEAGQNFFARIGRMRGLDPLQMAVWREQGAFGTGASAFGPGSVYSRFAAANGLGTPARAGSNRMLIFDAMDQARKEYGNNPLMMANAVQNLFGIGINQAMALSTLSPGQLGGMESRLGRLNIDLGNVNETGFNLLSQIEAGDRNALALVARDLAGREGDRALSSSEQAALQGAWDSGDDDALRDTLATLVARHGQAETEGEKVRNSIAGVERVVQEFASRLVPLTTDIRHGVMFLAGERGGSPNDIRAAVLRSESSARIGDIEVNKQREIDAQRALIDGLSTEYGDLFEQRRKEAWAGTLDDDKLAAYNKRLGEITEQRTTASNRIRELYDEQTKLIEQENQALQRRIDDMLEAERVRRKAEDEAMAARAGGSGGSVSYGSMVERFPQTGPASYGGGGGLGAAPAGTSAGDGGGITPVPAGPASGRYGGGSGIIGPEIAAALDAEGITDPAERRNIASMLSGISGVEGAGWNTIVGGGSFSDFSRHPNKIGIRTADGPSTAAGAYQITGTTWRRVSARLGLTDFSPTSQTRAAIELMRGRGALGLAAAGDFSGAASRLGHEWQGLPTGASRNQGRRSWGAFYDHVSAGASNYDALTTLPELQAPANDGLGSGLFSPMPLSGSFTHQLDLTPEAKRMMNPLPDVKTTFGPPMPSGVQ